MVAQAYRRRPKPFWQLNDEEMFLFLFFLIPPPLPNNHLWNYTKTIVRLRLGDYCKWKPWLRLGP
jgi:hypothetical protein